MEELFKRFCHYYTVNEDECILDRLKEEAGEEFKEYQRKAIKYVKNLRRRAGKLGFGVDFESFCDCLEKYIDIKDGLTDDEKKNYLKVLISLSQIHDIDLRAELERYVTVKEVTVDYEESFEEEESTHEDIEMERAYFKKICLGILNGDKAYLRTVREEIAGHEIDLKAMEQRAISFVKEIRELTKRLGFGVREEDFSSMVSMYLSQKKEMTYEQKAVYLKILMYLSEIYGVNLRVLLSQSPVGEEKKAKNILDDLSNPLDEEELLKGLLEQRYNTGSFQIEELVLANDLMVKESDAYDYSLLQAGLVYRLLEIFLEKFSRYEYDALKEEFVHLVSEEDIEYLHTLEEETLYRILLDMKKGEVSRYIVKKYKLSDNLYKFLYLCFMEVANLKQENVGRISMFAVSKKKNTMGIFITGPEAEILEFVSDYIVCCVEEGLSYELKGWMQDGRLVLYSSEDTLEKRLAILQDIRKKKEDLVASFGTPLHMTGRIDGEFYGIARVFKTVSYEEYMNDLFEVAYYRTVGKLVLAKVDDLETEQVIRDFISLGEVTLGETELASSCLYHGVLFGDIKDRINQYIPYVIKSIAIYMEEDRRKEEFALEFKKSILYIANVMHGRDKREPVNLSLL